jgi:hypothetical protein
MPNILQRKYNELKKQHEESVIREKAKFTKEKEKIEQAIQIKKNRDAEQDNINRRRNTAYVKTIEKNKSQKRDGDGYTLVASYKDGITSYRKQKK